MENEKKPEKVPLLEKIKKSIKSEEVDKDYENYKQKKTTGRTSDGTTFNVPYTTDVMENLFDIRKITHHSIFEYITLSVFILQVFIFFGTDFSENYYLVSSLVWRFFYNAGIGYLLKVQSEQQLVVKFLKKHIFDHVLGKERVKEEKFIVRFVRKQLTRKMCDDYDFDSVPVEYNSWLLFRCLEDFILVNDLVAYCCFSFKLLNVPEHFTFFDVLRYISAIFLVLFNIWVKKDAHRVVKDFAWYWGDFFFLVDSNLVFDGVFEIIPHPMYSVGYIGYYGSALLTLSYKVLFISLIIHASQLIFLVYVENPHIQKTYGTSNPQRPSLIELEKLRKYFRKDAIGFFRIDIFKSSDVLCLVISVLTFIYTYALDNSSHMPLIMCFFWRMVSSAGVGILLYFQSKDNVWNKHFIKNGKSIREAFQQWKNIYNFLICITYVSFIAVACKSYTLPEKWTYGTVLLRHTVGCLLILLHVWTSCEMHEVIGDFGWFYGDFFIKELISSGRLYYTGIYRFLNNPEKFMGQAAFYGIALIANSWTLAVVAFVGHIFIYTFLRYVEEPHMRKIYGSSLVRSESGVEKGVRKEVNKFMNKDARIKSIFETVQHDIKEIGLKRVLSHKSLKNVVNKWANSLNDTETSIPNSPTSECTDEESESAVLLASSRDQDQGNLKKRRSSLSLNKASKLIEKTKEVMGETAEKVVQQLTTPKSNIEDLTSSDSTNQSDSHLNIPPTQSYHIEIQRISSSSTPSICNSETTSGSELESLTFELGSPIVVQWSAPRKYITSTDWIGVYRVTQNKRRSVTTTNCKGRWMYSLTGKGKSKMTEASENKAEKKSLNKEELNELISHSKVITSTSEKNSEGEEIVSGELIFEKSLIPWEMGAYEFRYHYFNGYNVMTVSQPFEIIVNTFSQKKDLNDEEKILNITKYLLPVVKNCLFLNKSIELDINEDFVALMGWPTRIGTGGVVTDLEKEKKLFSKRLFYSIKMIFGVEFSSELVDFFSTVKTLAIQINRAQNALSPISSN